MMLQKSGTAFSRQSEYAQGIMYVSNMSISNGTVRGPEIVIS